MSARYAVVIDGRVANVVVWNGADAWSPDGGEALPCGEEVGLGWTCEGGVFAPPSDGEPQ